MELFFTSLLLLSSGRLVYGGITFFNVIPEAGEICFEIEGAIVGPLKYSDQQFWQTDKEESNINVRKCNENEILESVIVSDGFVGWGLDEDGLRKVQVVDNHMGWVDFTHSALGYDTCGFKTGVFFGGYLTLGSTFSIDIACDEFEFFNNSALSVTCDNDDILISAKVSTDMDFICADVTKRFLAIGHAHKTDQFPLEILLLQAAPTESCTSCRDTLSSSSSRSSSSSMESARGVIIFLVALVCLLGLIVFCSAAFCYSRYRRNKQLKELERVRGKSIRTYDDEDTQIE